VRIGGFLTETEIITGTLPLILAWRKEFKHHFDDGRHRPLGVAAGAGR
jgi:hypothetical protein